MSKEISVSIHIEDDTGRSLQEVLGELFGKVREATITNAAVPPEVDTPVAAVPSNTRSFWAAVYDSERQAFALGHKLYDSADGVLRNRNAPNYSHACGFILDLTNRRVVGPVEESDKRYWAVLQDGDTFSLGRNSFTSRASLDAEYPAKFAVLVGAEDADGNVVLGG